MNQIKNQLRLSDDALESVLCDIEELFKKSKHDLINAIIAELPDVKTHECGSGDYDSNCNCYIEAVDQIKTLLTQSIE